MEFVQSDLWINLKVLRIYKMNLNISIPESSNPLTDSLVISVKDPTLLGHIQETIETREEVKEVYKDESY